MLVLSSQVYQSFHRQYLLVMEHFSRKFRYLQNHLIEEQFRQIFDSIAADLQASLQSFMVTAMAVQCLLQSLYCEVLLVIQLRTIHCPQVFEFSLKILLRMQTMSCCRKMSPMAVAMVVFHLVREVRSQVAAVIEEDIEITRNSLLQLIDYLR